MIAPKWIIKVCKDYTNIENYNKAIVDKGHWQLHHRLETHTSDGTLREIPLSKAELIALNMYYDRPASELIFMKQTEHNKLHASYRNYKDVGNKTWITRRKRGHVSYNFGNTVAVGRRWFNNGIVSVMQYECPEGFVPGRIMRNMKKGRV